MNIRKTTLGLVLAAGLFGGAQSAIAQTADSPVLCRYTWCWTHVQVTQNASGQPVANITWNQFQMGNKLSGVTFAWILVGSPDYEFRADSVVITGANAPGSAAQLPFRQVLPERYAIDDLNTNNLPYAYELRVYKKGSPTPITASGTIVNSFN